MGFDVMLDDAQRSAFVGREREYNIRTWPYHALESDADPDAAPRGEGVICAALASDTALPPAVAEMVARLGLPSLWHWPHESGRLEPADIYLRHCLLANQKAGGEAYRSFVEDTYLADRKTTIKEYLVTDGDRVLEARPPDDLAVRFGGG